jgi:hypothetical protein
MEKPFAFQWFAPAPAGSVNVCGPGAVQPNVLPVIAAVNPRLLPEVIVSVSVPVAR